MSRAILHLLYADDMVIFANGGKISMKMIKEVLNLYAQWLGQVINEDKSSIFLSSKISPHQHRDTLRLTGFSAGSFPVKYLGVPIISGRMKIIYLEELLMQIRKKIDGWKMRFLSSGACLILLKLVLSSLPVHLMYVLHVPKLVFMKITRLFSMFFWGSIEGKPKKKWVKWDLLCKPVDEGGVGLRTIFDVKKSLHFKFAWELFTEKSVGIFF